jgi:hypothetical protein
LQAVRDIQQKRFLITISDIVHHADMRVGEIRQFCQLSHTAQRALSKKLTW